MRTFRCPKCGLVEQQPAWALQVGHWCQGRVREMRPVPAEPPVPSQPAELRLF